MVDWLISSAYAAEAYRIRDALYQSASDFERVFALRFALLRLERREDTQDDVHGRISRLGRDLDDVIATYMTPRVEHDDCLMAS